MQSILPFGLFALLPALLLAEPPDLTDDADEGNGSMRQGLFQQDEIKVGPIQLPKDNEHLQRAIYARQTKWVEGLLLADFSKRNAGAAWVSDALAVLREAAPYLSGESYENPLTGKNIYPSDALIQRARATRSAGCDDPLFNLIEPYLESFSRARTPEQMTLAERRLPDLLKGGDSPHLKLFACSWIWGGRYDHRATKDAAKRAAMEEQIPQLLAAALDSSATPEDSLGFYQFIKRNQGYMIFYLKMKTDDARGILEKSKAAAWVKNTLIGEFEITEAWKARGNGYADTVTAEGWKGFREHLTQACTRLSTAWQENPTVPFAAEAMITVTMGGAGLDGVDEREWFDRTTAACFDYMPAYHSLLWAYRPRWGGSHALMLTFGKACANTRRYDTFVPAILNRAVGNVASELPDHSDVFDDAEICRLGVEIERGMMPYAKSDDEKHYALSYGTCNAYLARDYALAASYYAALKQPIRPKAESALESYGIQSLEWRGVLAMQSDPTVAKTLLDAERAYRKGDLAAALPLYQSLSRLPSMAAQKDAVTLIRLRLAAIAVEGRFAKGEWVRLNEEEHQALWISASEAKWNTLPGGVLSVRIEKDRAFSRVILNARVGLDFELRAHLDNPKELAASQFGAVIGYWLGHPGVATMVCGTTSKSNASGAALVAQAYDTNAQNPPVPLALKPDSQIRIVSRNGKVTLWIDEKQILTRDLDACFKRRSPSRQPGQEQHLIGFGSRLFPIGESRLKDIEFRNLARK